LQIADTVKITTERGVCLTEGIKQSKDVLFFLNNDAEPAKKAPKAVPRNDVAGGSPVKNKMAGGKVLRNKTRSTAQQEAANSAAVKLGAHQRELHETRQREGLAKYSEEGKGGAGKEGKSWKRFLSYKTESALPSEVQTLRVILYNLFSYGF
jgi:nucleosome binding factor SPN SPT16 subunit